MKESFEFPICMFTLCCDFTFCPRFFPKASPPFAPKSQGRLRIKEILVTINIPSKITPTPKSIAWQFRCGRIKRGFGKCMCQTQDTRLWKMYVPNARYYIRGCGVPCQWGSPCNIAANQSVKLFSV